MTKEFDKITVKSSLTTKNADVNNIKTNGLLVNNLNTNSLGYNYLIQNNYYENIPSTTSRNLDPTKFATFNYAIAGTTTVLTLNLPSTENLLVGTQVQLYLQTTASVSTTVTLTVNNASTDALIFSTTQSTSANLFNAVLGATTGFYYVTYLGQALGSTTKIWYIGVDLA